MTFKVGDKIKLVDNSSCVYALTLGNVYEVKRSAWGGDCVYVLDDGGDEVGPFSRRFELVKELKLKLPLVIKRLDTTYVLSAGSEDAVDLTVADTGQVFKRHVTCAEVVKFINSGIWVPVTEDGEKKRLEDAVKAAEQVVARAEAELQAASAALAAYQPSYFE